MRKKFLKNGVIAMMAVCGLAFVSCSEDNDEGMKSYKLTVSYSLPSDVEAQAASCGRRQADGMGRTDLRKAADRKANGGL